METEDSSEIKILVASDIHLGYAEKDPIRKQDSFETFEEVLQIAERNNVDMLLLGGDLFHENKPSRATVFACTELLRKYCLNDRPVTLEFVSDASVNFVHSTFPHVNYLDPNLNIGLPVFSINGNHDDVGGNGLSALDQLHATGLVNYFGKCRNLQQLDISPILLQKSDQYGNKTKLSLYGLGSIRDERLFRLFDQGQVTFLTFDDKAEQKSWNNIFVLHQNRVKHGPTNYIPENFLPEFLDLVIWGHEHPCRIRPEETSFGFKIMQPGSTVATSLAEGEAGQKCVSLLRIKGKTMMDEVIRLKTVRPFYFEDITLSELDIKPGRVDTLKRVEQYLHDRVLDYIRQSEEDQNGNPNPKLPLIRLRVDFSGYDVQTFSSIRFGRRFINKVANANKDIVLFYQKREPKAQTKVDFSVLNEVMRKDAQELRGRVEDLVKKYFEGVEKQQKMLLLTDNALGVAVTEFVEKDERDAIGEIVKQQLTRIQKKIEDRVGNEKYDPDAVKDVLDQIREMRLQHMEQTDEEESNEIKNVLEESRKRRQSKGTNGVHDENENGNDEIVDGMDDEPLVSPLLPSTSRGNGTSRSRGRGTRGSRGSTGRGNSVTNADEGPSTSTPTRARGGRRGASTRGQGRDATKRRQPDGDGENGEMGQRSIAGYTRSAKKLIKRNNSSDDVEIVDI